jgi:hypothetical protein
MVTSPSVQPFAHVCVCAPRRLRLSSKKMKFFFSRYLTYARDAGDDALVAQVKEKARVWVENATKADDD